MDHAVLVGAISAAAAAALSGPGCVLLFSRRLRRGQVRLTEAQAGDLETRVYDRVVAQLERQLDAAADREQQLEDRVAELEASLRQLRAERDRDADRERDLLAELATVRRERDEARAALQARDAELAQARTQLEQLGGLLARPGGPTVVVHPAAEPHQR